jgi:glycosyltransferase involved in cell wall biosynthesis
MKILLTHVKLDIPGGSEVVLAILAREWVRRGHDVRIFSALPTGVAAERLRNSGIPVSTDMGAIVKDWRPDVVHVCHAHHTMEAVLKFCDGVPIVQTCHGVINDEAGDKRAKVVACVSEEVRGKVINKDGIEGHRIVIVRNGIPEGLMRPGPYNAGGPVVYWGRVMADHQRTIEAAAMIAKAFKRPLRVHGVSVADGHDKAKQYAEAVGVKVEVHGVAWDPKAAIQSASLVIANGRCALEAMFLGIPAWVRGDRGVDGFLLNEDRVWASARYNFSGRALLQKPITCEQLADMDLAHIHSATAHLRTFLSRHFAARQMIEGYAAAYDRALK